MPPVECSAQGETGMAIIHSRIVGTTRYEIRSAGRSVRLYTNGVLHTQYNPAHQATGGVWDLLGLPAAALPKVQRVLMLGVGGGAAVHLLRQWFPGVHITGVDLSRVHLALARRYFGLKGAGLRLVCGDAREFVSTWQGEPFDLIIEDLFGDNAGQPVRAFAADRRWCQQLWRLLSPQGALVINTLSRTQLRACAVVADPVVRKLLPGRLFLTQPAYENVVGAFFREPVTAQALRGAIRRHPLLAKLEKAGKLRQRIHRLG